MAWVIILILSRINPEMGGLKGLLNPDQNWAKSNVSSYPFGQDEALQCPQRGTLSKVLQSILRCPHLLALPGWAFHRANPDLCRAFYTSLRWASLKLLLRERDGHIWGSPCVLLPAAPRCIEGIPSHVDVLASLQLWSSASPREDGIEQEEFQLKANPSEKGYWFDSAGNNPFAPHTAPEQRTGK